MRTRRRIHWYGWSDAMTSPAYASQSLTSASAAPCIANSGHVSDLNELPTGGLETGNLEIGAPGTTPETGNWVGC